MKHAHLPSDPLSCPWRLGLELIGYREVEKVYERFPLSRAVNPLLFHNFYLLSPDVKDSCTCMYICIRDSDVV